MKKVIGLTDIVAVKGANNYSEVILDTKERYLCDQSLGSLLKEIPDRFFRIHKSYLVDFNQVESIRSSQSGGKIIRLRNQLEIPVGRKFIKELKHRIL